MKAPPTKPLDLFTVQQATARNRQYVDETARRVWECKHDTDRKQRLAARECPWCFYHRRGAMLAGQAFTEWACWACGNEDSHANTATPRLCNECADKLGLCCRCCADIYLTDRKKLERKLWIDRSGAAVAVAGGSVTIQGGNSGGHFCPACGHRTWNVPCSLCGVDQRTFTGTPVAAVEERITIKGMDK